MKDLKIVLKNVQRFEGLEGEGFNADVWINNTKCLHAHDSANGGMIDYYDYSHKANDSQKVKDLIEQFDKHINSLPEVEFEFGDRISKLKMDRDLFINELLEKHLMNKLFKNSIVIGKPNAAEYQQFKFKIPLSKVPLNKLQQQVIRLKKEYCTDGKVIQNTNLKKLGIIV